MLGARLLRGSRHVADSLLFIDGLPEGLRHLRALQPFDDLSAGTQE